MVDFGPRPDFLIYIVFGDTNPENAATAAEVVRAVASAGCLLCPDGDEIQHFPAEANEVFSVSLRQGSPQVSLDSMREVCGGLDLRRYRGCRKVTVGICRKSH